jgi:hypothetical protein
MARDSIENIISNPDLPSVSIAGQIRRKKIAQKLLKTRNQGQKVRFNKWHKLMSKIEMATKEVKS